MKQIPLTQEKFTLVDEQDFDYLSQWKWCLNKDGYAVRNSKKVDGKKRLIFMHRIINNTPDGFITDHIDRNKLNNQKDNLRISTKSQNAINTGLQKNNISGYKGIHWYKNREKYQVYIEKNNKRIHLGYYSNIQGAWLARRWGEKLYHAEAQAIPPTPTA